MYNGIIKKLFDRTERINEEKNMTIYDILKDSSNGGNWKIIDINK